MKLKKIIARILILMIGITLGIQSSQSFAESGNKTLQLERVRYVYSYDSKEYVKKDGYELNTSASPNDSHHPIYQIVSIENGKMVGTNFYCLNARVGNTWNSSTIPTSAEYTQFFSVFLNCTVI